jgi:hypothetical protein
MRLIQFNAVTNWLRAIKKATREGDLKKSRNGSAEVAIHTDDAGLGPLTGELHFAGLLYPDSDRCFEGTEINRKGLITARHRIPQRGELLDCGFLGH